MGTTEPLGVYKGKKVLITGHTGFKGSWLTLWLSDLGAVTHGYALPPPTDPSLFRLLKLHEVIDHHIEDIRDPSQLKKTIAAVKPDIIFHLAAQSLVRDSYDSPLYTVEVNTLGTVHVLEAVRQLNLPVALVMVTSDKCYENREWVYSYRESDALGGHDPYSASKGAAEILINSWRDSFFPPDTLAAHGVRVASVRAGNVVGGGDWTKDNLVPDCIRGLQQGKVIEVRNPEATRPWQHVLEALGGYLLLGARLLDATPSQAKAYCGAFNFGPKADSSKRVCELVEEIIHCWGEGSWSDVSSDRSPHEASLLRIAIDKAFHVLKWSPKLDFEATIRQTVDWYKFLGRDPGHILEYTLKQIHVYQADTNRQAVKHPTERLLQY